MSRFGVMAGQRSTQWGLQDLAAPYDQAMLERFFPYREVSLLIQSDRRLNDPIYGLHRWWARRPPALLRALLVAAAASSDSSQQAFWETYESDAESLSDLRVHDPFIGGGSTLVEAARLGAKVSGGDVDPLAVEIVRYGLNPAPAEAIKEAGEALLRHVRQTCGHLYPAKSGSQPLHYFWLHEVTCPSCEEHGLLYRNLVLARDRGKAGAVVRDDPLIVFCPEDLSVHSLDSAERVELRHGHKRWKINRGTFVNSRYACPYCGTQSNHQELATGMAPRVLVATEETAEGSHRIIREPSPLELRSGETAARWLEKHLVDLDLPKGRLSADRHDRRPLSYGMTKMVDLFSDRQLACLGTAFRWVRQSDLPVQVKAGLRLAISNALATNNKLCSYAHDYGRLAPLFSVRGYSLPSLSVELNPLHDSAGRGTLHHCIERVGRAGCSANRRNVWSLTLKRPEVVDMIHDHTVDVSDVLVRSATGSQTTKVASADLCVFDPPYFDYIAYSELSEFYRGWMPSRTSVDPPLLPSGDDPGESFGLELGVAMRAALGRLKPGRPLIFTYHSTNAEAWRAVGIAMDEAKLRITALWPVYSDGHMGHHSHPGNCEWDLLIVCRRLEETVPSEFTEDIKSWAAKVKPLKMGRADRQSIRLAIAIATPRFGVAAKE